MDTSSLINLFRHTGIAYPPYSPDVFEGLWIKLEEIIEQGLLISHITVLREVERRDDEVRIWCNKHKKIFKDINECQLLEIQKIMRKYSKKHWNDEISQIGQEWADPWIIALAICENAVIISDEKNSPDRIPYISSHFGITTVNLLDFFRNIGLKWKK